MDMSDVRILIVDDEDAIRRNLEKELRRAGYSLIEQAPGSRAAVEVLQQAPIHLAILDLWMPNLDGDMSDRAGIDLLAWITENHPEVFVLMLSGAGTIQIALEARELGADFLEKDRLTPAMLRQKVKELVKINFDLQINLGAELANPEDDEVLRRLFLDSSEINVSLLAPVSKGAAIYRVTPRDRDGRWMVPYATKIGWKDQIIPEDRNYFRWVEHQLGGRQYATVIDKPAYTRNRGGIKMFDLSFKVKSLEDFSTFFRRSDTAVIIEALSSLFKDTLGPWYENRRFESLFLTREYGKYLDVEKWDLSRYMQRYLGDYAGVSQIHFKEAHVSFSNPIACFERLLTSPDREWRTYVCTVHGDLNASNIMVDSRNDCWLIDFSRTGEAHILRDFVELETAIKFGILETEDLRDLCDLESCLMSQREFEDKEGFEGFRSFSHPNEEIQKAFEVIRELRQCASGHVANVRSRTSSRETDISEYYVGLLFHTLYMIRFREDVVSRTKKMCILYSASLICEALESMR